MGGRGSSGTAPATMSLDRIGRLQSGNEQGMTVAQEYRQKEVLGRYSASDWARANVGRAAGERHPRDYQASITAHVKEHGQVNPGHVSGGALDEGYHRYAAARQLGHATMRVRKYD
jgi:hypothetical protein